MNYKRIYDEIINNRLKNPIIDSYTENHHIIPRSLGGSNSSENLVRLTAREHFICHWLLVKIYPSGPQHYKMSFALNMMLTGQNRKSGTRYIPKSYFYANQREHMSKAMSSSQKGSGNSQYGKKWFSNPTTKETKKFHPKNVPTGWISGRIINWDRYFGLIKCKLCNTNFKPNKKESYCSTQCAKIVMRSNNQKKYETNRKTYSHLESHKDEIISLFSDGFSISDICRRFNVKPAGKWFYIVKTICHSN